MYSSRDLWFNNLNYLLHLTPLVQCELASYSPGVLTFVARARRACVRPVLFCLFLFPQVASLVSFIVIECTYDTLSNYLQLVWDLTFLRKYKVVT